jgi:hypothetical protein
MAEVSLGQIPRSNDGKLRGWTAASSGMPARCLTGFSMTVADDSARCSAPHAQEKPMAIHRVGAERRRLPLLALQFLARWLAGWLGRVLQEQVD